MIDQAQPYTQGDFNRQEASASLFSEVNAAQRAHEQMLAAQARINRGLSAEAIASVGSHEGLELNNNPLDPNYLATLQEMLTEPSLAEHAAGVVVESRTMSGAERIVELLTPEQMCQMIADTTRYIEQIRAITTRDDFTLAA